ncbi:MAG TPA: S9 family peptidase [Streptosporangiaceae bacterium]|nr:S9 family peptidase [Streptosporangiaceae bacterium]
MSADPTTTSPVPPTVKQVPSVRTFHGDAVTDPYAWLCDKEDPDTIAFLNAENDYTEALTAGEDQLRDEIFAEIKGRTRETDLSVPARRDGWWYYGRSVEGQQYGLQCRVAAGPGDEAPPVSADGGALPGEQVLLDANELAGDSEFFSLGALSVSPDGHQLAYSTDFAGDERFTLRIKNLKTGELAADEIPNTFYGAAWSLDGSALFYVTVDDAWRPWRVWRHLVGTPHTEDAVIFEEPDEKFWVGVGLTRSHRFLMVSSASKVTSEVWLLDAAEPEGELRVVAPRRPGLEYEVEHQVFADGTQRLLILHNDGAVNFALAEAPVDEPGRWTTLIPGQDSTRLLDVDAFTDFTVVYYRRDGLTGLRVIRADGSDYDVDFPEPVYTVSPGGTPDPGAAQYRLHFASLVTPDSVYDCVMATGELILRRRQPVLPLPGNAADGTPAGREYRPEDYEQYREWATAPDGTQVPISLVCRRGTPRDGSAPGLIYGYGSYEISVDPRFSIARLSLLDRGFVYAIAHIRGGGELGRTWYDDGKMLHKKNTFSDFVACARHLATGRWTSADRLVARGGSAGGLLMGAAVNAAPDAFAGVVAQVPFVDALTSILDPSLPLTVTEWEEWGDPLHDPEVYQYMRSYTPYENVRPVTYPPILAMTSLNDTRVLYREPARWIARLQATAKGGPFLLKTEMNAGHGGRSGRYDAWHEEAFVLAWTIGAATAA